MVSQAKLDNLREVITANLRVQRDGQKIDYVNVGKRFRMLAQGKITLSLRDAGAVKHCCSTTPRAH
jgi:hypothetical protein